MKYAPLLVTTLIILAGIALFITSDAVGKQERMSGAIYKDLALKVGYTETGEPKLFTQADPARLKQYKAAEGANIPTTDSMVLGAAEANMMRKEKLFNSVGDEFESFFGIRTRIGGVLTPTNSTLDELHFLSKEQYDAIEGESNRAFILRTPEGMPKLFYTLGSTEDSPLQITLAEGERTAYTPRTIEGVTYYPVFIGSAEAAMMREEKLFTNVGDTIEGFFNTNIVIAGILAQTNTSVDMMHIIPADAQVK